MIVVLMGVCGCGKTTVAQALQNKLGWSIAEADDYHPDANKSKMAAGIPLSDEDRFPWLLSLHHVMQTWLNTNNNGIVTCSALKKSYRDILRYGTATPVQNSDPNSNPGILFVLLNVSEQVLTARMKARSGHFMPSSLLTSQLATLEMPTMDEHVLVVSVEKGTDDIVDEIRGYLSDKCGVQL